MIFQERTWRKSCDGHADIYPNIYPKHASVTQASQGRRGEQNDRFRVRAPGAVQHEPTARLRGSSTRYANDPSQNLRLCAGHGRSKRRGMS
jgi:hypothetical protein